MTEERQDTAIRRDRFSGGPARTFLSSMENDARIFDADLAVDRAHTIMLAEQGIIERDAAVQILEALETIERTGYDALPDAEDVHEAIETQVISDIGDAGGLMHTARSRNDEVATCLRYQLRIELLSLLEEVVTLREVCVDMATSHTETVMPGYTHLQPAQPITVAHWACSYERALSRDSGRLLDAYERINLSPLGGAAFAGTPFPIDRHRTAELLGFDGLVTNAMDAATSRDALAEVLGAAAILNSTLSSLAEDVILFSHREFLELDDDYSSTSSIMPQKKNPDSLELVRATSGDAIGGFTGMLTTLKGLPRAYNRDLQQATPHLWRTIDAVRDATRVSAGALDTAIWNQQTLYTAAAEGFSTATGVADLLAANGVPFRQAHEVVAEATSATTDNRIEAIEQAVEQVLDTDLWEYITASELEAVLDLDGSVASRDSVGGPAPAATNAQIADTRDEIAADRESIVAIQQQLEDASTSLETEVRRYV